MGTRSLTLVLSGALPEELNEKSVAKAASDALVTIYRQYDGYPKGQGKFLLSLLSGHKFSLGRAQTHGLHNGPSDLAAFVAMKMKETCKDVADPECYSGGVYIQHAPEDGEYMGAEFLYFIAPDPSNTGEFAIVCWDVWDEKVIPNNP